jgi:hypothetical protein
MGARTVTIPNVRQVAKQLPRVVGFGATLLLCTVPVGCRGCATPGSASPDAAPESPRVEDLGVRAPMFGVSQFRRIDLGDLSLRVPDSWIREDLDAGWTVVRFDAPGDVGARLQVMRHPEGERWDDTIAGLIDAGWTPDDASATEPAVFHGNLPAVAHEVVRALLSGRFLVAIHCQYFEDTARPICDEQFGRLELDLTGRDAGAPESHGFRFVGAPGWHRMIEPPSNEVFETDGYPFARVLVVGVAVAPARAAVAVADYRAGLAKEPEVSIKTQKPLVYLGRTGIELQLDVATFALQVMRATHLFLPSGEAIVSCQGPSIPELDRVCEASMRSVAIRTADPARAN